MSRDRNIRRILTALVMLLSVALHCAARGVTFAPLSFSRDASTIFTGEVIELRDKTILVAPKKAVKGTLPSQSVELPWTKVTAWEETAVHYELGQSIMVFLKTRDGKDISLGETLDLKSKFGQQGGALVEELGRLDGLPDKGAKQKAISRMLASGDKGRQIEALHLIYLCSEAKEGPGALHAPAVALLLRSSDPQIAGNAVQAIERIGDRSHIPLLIDLVESPLKYVPATAAMALRVWIPYAPKIELNPKSEQDRKRVANEWRLWWKVNGEKTPLMQKGPCGA